MRRRLAGVVAGLALGAVTACGSAEPEAGRLLAGEPATTPAASPAPQVLGLGKAPEPTTPPASPEPAPEQSAPPEPAPEPAPPSPPPRYEGECIASREGPQATQEEVAAALIEAAGRTYWPISAPQISLPRELVKAVAWQESGWQSEIVACDGGVGVMQVMPDTAEFLNDRFQVSYDPHTLDGNATLGANYLAWLVKYFGDVHFDQRYQLDPATCADHLDPCLLNAVIAGYNFGPAAVETGDGLAIPNPQYVANVRALMADCVCLSY